MAFQILKDRVGRWSGRATTQAAPSKVEAGFRLLLGERHVGSLSRFEGVWRFEYSEAWKQQKQFRPIAQFPDVQKVYESHELWPFFALRIPSLKQEAFRQIVEHDRVDAKDEAEMLSRYGKRTASNPFELSAC